MVFPLPMFPLSLLPIISSGHYLASLPLLPVPALGSSLVELCALLGITLGLQSPPSSLRFGHRRVQAGDNLCRLGAPFQVLYAQRSGFTKTVTQTADGGEQVVGFSLKGALLGIDGIAHGRHMSSVIALSDAEFIVIPLEVIRAAAIRYPGLTRGMYAAMARELARTQPVTSRLGLTTRGRIGRLLLDLAERFAAMGYSSSNFNLPMPRADIASYLGMAQATVSRGLIELEAKGLIRLDHRAVQILDHTGLRELKRSRRSPQSFD